MTSHIWGIDAVDAIKDIEEAVVYLRNTLNDVEVTISGKIRAILNTAARLEEIKEKSKNE